MISHTFYFRWICHCSQQSNDSLDAYCAGPRSMDNYTETALMT